MSKRRQICFYIDHISDTKFAFKLLGVVFITADFRQAIMTRELFLV